MSRNIKTAVDYAYNFKTAFYSLHIYIPRVAVWENQPKTDRPHGNFVLFIGEFVFALQGFYNLFQKLHGFLYNRELPNHFSFYVAFAYNCYNFKALRPCHNQK